YVRQVPRRIGEKLGHGRIKSIFRDNVPGEGAVAPGAVDQFCRGGIVNRVALSSECEIAAQLIGSWNRSEGGLIVALVMHRPPEKEKRLVLAVVDLWNEDRPAGNAGQFMVAERCIPQIEVGAVQHVIIDVTVLALPMEPVRT